MFIPRSFGKFHDPCDEIPVARFFFGQRIKDATCIEYTFSDGTGVSLALLRHAEKGKYEGVRPERDHGNGADSTEALTLI